MTMSAPLQHASLPPARLRALLADRSRCTVLPAIHDGLSARVVGRSGHAAAFLSGYAVSASLLGLHDAGLCGYDEMEGAARRCVAALPPGFPVIGDGDTGFGGPGNIRRLIRGYASAGLAGVSVEDQTFPKRCSYAQGMACVDLAAAEARVRCVLEAAKEVRETTGRDLVVVGRTDVRNDAKFARPRGDADAAVDEAVRRAERFAELGCDVVYAEGLQGEAEHARLHSVLGPDIPTLLAQVEKPGREVLSAAEAQARGFRLLLHGLTVLSAQLRATEDALVALAGAQGGKGHGGGGLLADFDHLYDTVGFGDLDAWERRHPGV